MKNIHEIAFKNTLFFLNKRLFLSLALEKIRSIFVLSTGIKRKRPKPETMLKRNITEPILRNGAFALSLLVSVLFTNSGLKAQGWQVSFGGPKEDRATALVGTKDGGFLVAGYSESFGADLDNDVYLIRTDADGKQLWAQVYDEGDVEQAYDVIELENGDFLVVGSIKQNVGDLEDVYLLRVNAAGKQIWSRRFGKATTYEQGKKVIEAVNGGFIIIGKKKDAVTGEDDMLVIKTDALGQEMWSKTYGSVKDDEATSIAAYKGGYVFVGSSDNPHPNTFDKDIMVYRINVQGDTIWTKTITVATAQKEEAYDVIATKDGNIIIAGVVTDEGDGFIAKLKENKDIIWSTLIGGSLGQEAHAVVELNDGSFAITGITETSTQNIDVLFARIDKNGNIIKVSNLGQKNTTDWGEDIVATSDGGFAIVGYRQLTLVAITDVLLLKADSQGNTRTNYITGQVFFDRDGACDLDPSDPPLKEWLVKVTGGNQTYFGTTDENGRYLVLVDTGRYNITVLPATQYWESCIAGGYNVNLTNFYDTTSLNFPMTVAQSCPYLEVDISTPFLTVCSDVKYEVAYCNLGTATANNAYVEVTLDEKLAFVSSSIPFNSQKGKTYSFPLGNISATQCGRFTIQTQLACNGIADGQAALVKVHIYPDTVCLKPGPEWDGSSVVVSGQCGQDSINFLVKNAGRKDMLEPRKYYVIQQDVVFRTGNNTFQLPAGQSLGINIGKDGKTYRLIAEQSKDHPGNSYPTVAIEGCASSGQPTSTGYIDQFPEDDQDNFIDTDVQEIIGSISATQMRGYPKGYQDSLITAETEITYKILFKNAGTDTIRRVVIRDTLSPNLDIATLSLGTGSHPYKFELTGNGVLKITFDNIELLPDGSANGTSNWGFVNFRIAQKPNNTKGTLIKNRAAIYFNYTAPVMTNEIRHRIDTFPQFITVAVNEPNLPDVKINVSPNPFTESVKFEIETEGRIFKELIFSVYDILGRRIDTRKYSGNQFMYYRNQMTTGTYFYRLESEGQLINSGKLLVR